MRNVQKLDVFGVTFISSVLLSFADYDNSTDVERGNVAWILDHAGSVVQCDADDITSPNNASVADGEWRLHYSAIETHDRFGGTVNTALKADLMTADVIHVVRGNTQQVWVRLDIQPSERLASLLDALERLDDYPAIDDVYASDAAWRLVDAAWPDYEQTIIQEAQAWCDAQVESGNAKASPDVYATVLDQHINVNKMAFEWGMDFHIEGGGVVCIDSADIRRFVENEFGPHMQSEAIRAAAVDLTEAINKAAEAGLLDVIAQRYDNCFASMPAFTKALSEIIGKPRS